tara:strand:+ start:9224 stop:10276 length:1053 start_codon:yes stop_codon:yes gene_type:complete
MVVLINNEIVKDVLVRKEVIESIEIAFRQLGNGDATFFSREDIVSPTTMGDYFAWGSMSGAMVDPPRLSLRFKSDVIRYVDKGGHLSEEKFNGTPGKFMGVILLFDTRDGSLLAIMNDGVIQHERVGATAAIACDHLSNDDSKILGIIGSGGMARSYAMNISEVRELEEIKVYSPTEENRISFQREISEELGVKVKAMKTPKGAVKEADIVATCTASQTPVFSQKWLEPGMTLIDVRSTEIDNRTIKEVDQIFSTTNKNHRVESIGGEGTEKYQLKRGKRGFIQTRYSTLSEIICKDEIGRKDKKETIYYHNRSAGIQFVAVGNLIYERASELKLGEEIPMEWFQQSIRN